MNEELLIKAMQLFQTAEKWNAFNELANRRDDIQYRWWQKLRTEVHQRELHGGDPDWVIFTWGNWEIRWYVKGEHENSLAIHFSAHQWLRICSGFGYLEPNKVNKLIEDQRFNEIVKPFDRIDWKSHDSIGAENKNFEFGSIHDHYFHDTRALAWYAGNETEKFADQLIAKVRKFQTPKITALFKEINEKCRKDNP